MHVHLYNRRRWITARATRPDTSDTLSCAAEEIFYFWTPWPHDHLWRFEVKIFDYLRAIFGDFPDNIYKEHRVAWFAVFFADVVTFLWSQVFAIFLSEKFHGATTGAVYIYTDSFYSNPAVMVWIPSISSKSSRSSFSRNLFLSLLEFRQGLSPNKLNHTNMWFNFRLSTNKERNEKEKCKHSAVRGSPSLLLGVFSSTYFCKFERGLFWVDNFILKPGCLYHMYKSWDRFVCNEAPVFLRTSRVRRVAVIISARHDNFTFQLRPPCEY